MFWWVGSKTWILFQLLSYWSAFFLLRLLAFFFFFFFSSSSFSSSSSSSSLRGAMPLVSSYGKTCHSRFHGKSIMFSLIDTHDWHGKIHKNLRRRTSFLGTCGRCQAAQALGNNWGMRLKTWTGNFENPGMKVGPPACDDCVQEGSFVPETQLHTTTQMFGWAMF